jgi:hypothetical protein
VSQTTKYPDTSQSGKPPDLSYILATDAYDTIRPVISRLRRQTARHVVEVVLVAPSAESVKDALTYRDEFAGMQIVVVDSIHPLGRARAAGIRAATAAIIFVGETHSYPHPRFAETLIAAHAGPWASVAPAFGNANPSGALSWAGFVSDYGRWSEGFDAGEIPETPLYNATYRRAALLAMNDRLEHALSCGDELPRWLRAQGHRCYHEPAARLDHLNVARSMAFVRERFVAGVLIGSNRARQWSLGRRLVYMGGAPLIPVVLLARVLPGLRETIRRVRLPLMTLPLMVLGIVVKAAGEFVGYAGASGHASAREMHEYEIHKLAYAGRKQA